MSSYTFLRVSTASGSPIFPRANAAAILTENFSPLSVSTPVKVSVASVLLISPGQQRFFGGLHLCLWNLLLFLRKLSRYSGILIRGSTAVSFLSFPSHRAALLLIPALSRRSLSIRGFTAVSFPIFPNGNGRIDPDGIALTVFHFVAAGFLLPFHPQFLQVQRLHCFVPEDNLESKFLSEDLLLLFPFSLQEPL